MKQSDDMREALEFEGNKILQVLGCEYDQSKILVRKVNGDEEIYYKSAPDVNGGGE